MLQRLKIESITPDNRPADKYGNKGYVVKVFGDPGFYVTRSGKIAQLPINQEHELEVTAMTSQSGTTYYKLTMPQAAGFGGQASSTGERPASGKNDQLIIRQVAYKGVIELITAGKVELIDLPMLIEQHAALIASAPAPTPEPTAPPAPTQPTFDEAFGEDIPL